MQIRCETVIDKYDERGESDSRRSFIRRPWTFSDKLISNGTERKIIFFRRTQVQKV